MASEIVSYSNFVHYWVYVMALCTMRIFLFWGMSTMSKFTTIIGTTPRNISFHAWYLFYDIVIKTIAL